MVVKYYDLPFGISVAPEIFHRVFTEIFGHIKGVKVYIDDILIFAKNVKEHNEILKQILETAHQKGVRFKKNKCKIFKDEIRYVGHIFNKNGIKSDNDKIEAITKILPPDNKDKVRKFLGMITYVSRFMPNLAEKAYNLRQLLK
ncbi:Retrovirus-related Pol polyprotein from transposon 17.6-like Protein [Tribolium castaneum]|uniref:Retrovirus-related Pol polyprotein from transposon 17.6-like Protein n=1 Tax=Tribolium castaneum TaxID=7070 RepID=A0A139W8T0_TRICA|nr:Retrovirus-related Pol polyprotein from transposon 17.6-like Protein [Tribolium castaneum]